MIPVTPTFQTFGLGRDLETAVAGLGFTEPTPIQRDAIPPALEGRDVMACAATGSGKTAAFVLPILHRLAALPRGTTRALILTPTRELAAQIDEHRSALGRCTAVTGAAIFGGVGMDPQVRALRRGVDIVVATPGRLLDHMRSPHGRLAGIGILVLDEADRMLDMGFLPDIRRILRALPRERQTLFFSATMPDPIVALSREMLRNPVAINIERPAAPAAGITHVALSVREGSKNDALLTLLGRRDMRSVIVFTRTKHRANRVAAFLHRNRVAATRIHGNRSQTQRIAALQGFRTGTYRVLVATDIAARGIDVEEISHVVNFDVPKQTEDYIHRVGRTARAQALGTAITLFAPEEETTLRAIERGIGAPLRRGRLADSGASNGHAGGHGSSVESRTPAATATSGDAPCRADRGRERFASPSPSPSFRASSPPSSRRRPARRFRTSRRSSRA